MTYETEQLAALNISAVERLRAEMERNGRGAAPSSAPAPEAEELRLTRADLEDFLNNRRRPTMVEIEWLLAHGRDYEHKLNLTTGEEEQLRAMAARIQAEARLPVATRQAANDDSVVKTLGTFRTANGDLSRSDVARLEAVRMEAEGAIAVCKNHARERCRCWAPAREALFELRRAGEKSPLGICALAIWNNIEALAQNRNIEPPAPPPPPLSPQAAVDLSGGPVPNPYNWRFWKAPSYMDHVQLFRQ